jgi:hypothetical protein
MKTENYRREVWVIIALLLLPFRAFAFPPAPHHILYGIVRDELGNPLAAENAQLLFETAAGVKLTATIGYKGEPDRNYSLEVPMDSGVTSDAYMPTAMRPTAPFKIRVRIGNVTYLPIEMSGDYALLGQPGKKTRLNLTLGVDSDGDGLPDAWERNLISALHLNTLADINPGSDSDGDGMTNLDEYLAGTYAFDKEDGYALKIKTMIGSAAVLEFMAIRDRTYTIYSSPDLTHWTLVAFSVGGTAPRVLSWRANDVSVANVHADAAEGVRFFKLLIQ